MRVKKILLILCILSGIVVSLSGCYDSRNIENLAYTTALGLDVSPNDMLLMTLQISIPSSNSDEGSSQSNKTDTITVECSSISSGLSLINSYVSKEINLSHCKVIVFSEKLAEQGISEYIDTFKNNIEIRSDCNIIISKCDAKDFIENASPSFETLTARYYEVALSSTEYTGYTTSTELIDFFGNMKNDFIQASAILGGINNIDPSSSNYKNSNNSGNESNQNSENSSENNSGSSSGNDSENNSENSSGNDSGNNSGNSSGNNSGNNSGNSSENDSGNNSGSNSGNDSGNNSGSGSTENSKNNSNNNSDINSNIQPLSSDGNYVAGETPIKNSNSIETFGTAVFYDDKLVGELTGIETLCHLIVTSTLNRCTISVQNPFDINSTIDLYIHQKQKPKINLDFINGTPYISVEVFLEGYGLTLNKHIDYSSPVTLEQINKSAEQYLKSELENYLYKTSKEFKSDIAGFGKYALSKYLTIDKWHKSNWLENYKNSFFDVKVNVNIKSGYEFNNTP